MDRCRWRSSTSWSTCPRSSNRSASQKPPAYSISHHTLRYYERINLIQVPRDSVGNRFYDTDAVRRLVFLSRMRLSGMAIRDENLGSIDVVLSEGQLDRLSKLVPAGDRAPGMDWVAGRSA